MIYEWILSFCDTLKERHRGMGTFARGWMLLGLFIGLTACSTGHFRIYIEPTSIVNKTGRFLEKKARQAQWKSKYQVAVIDTERDALPKGIVKKGKRFTVTPSHAKHIQYLGIVDSKHGGSRMNALASSAFLFYDMHDSESSTLNTYCKVTFPLRTLTLGVWSLLPWSYPCWIDYPTDVRTNTRMHTQELRRAAHVMGGNIVVIERWRTQRINYVNQYGSSIKSEVIHRAGVRAHIFRRKEVLVHDSG